MMMNINKFFNIVFRTPLYAQLYQSHGIFKEDIKSFADIRKLPTIAKTDLLGDYTRAIGKPEEVIKYHTTSGTSGIPTVVAFTKNDWDVYVRQNIKCLQLIGSTKRDLFYNATPYGMFFAGLVLHDAVIKMGARVVPAAILPSVSTHFNLIDLFKPTVFIGIPQYLLKLGISYENIGRDPRELSFQRAYCLGEPLPDKKRQFIEDLFDIDIFCGYGLSEVGAGAECSEKLGFHWPIEDIYVEILDEQNGKGELTYTTLTKTGTLAVRFRSRDLGYIFDEPCPCGEKTPIISHIEERIDDLVKIRGTLISPYAIEEAMYSVRGVNNYLFAIDEEDGLDVVKVYVEGRNIKALDIRNAINGVTFITPNNIKIVPDDQIPIIGRKKKRFFDLRKHNSFNNIIRKFIKTT